MSRLSRRVPRVRWQLDDHWNEDQRADEVIVEEPLEIRSNGDLISTTMRTPGHDIDLIHGYLLSEGLIHTADDIREARYCAGAIGPGGTNTYNVLNITFAERGTVPVEFLRTTTTTSACGVCGTSSIAQIMAGRHGKHVEPIEPSPDVINELPLTLRAAQKSFKLTGGVHAAAIATEAGELIAIREDVGRHNAADKVIGHMLREGRIPATRTILVMSSRASFELVAKALAAGCSGLVAVSAPTSAAVELARSSGMFLAAFVRNNRFNVYSGTINQGS